MTSEVSGHAIACPQFSTAHTIIGYKNSVQQVGERMQIGAWEPGRISRTSCTGQYHRFATIRNRLHRQPL